MNEKAKVDKPGKQRINRYGFLLMWIAGQVTGWHLATTMGYGGYDWRGILIMGLLLGVPTVLVQVLSLYLYFGRLFRWWIAINLVGWILGVFCISNVSRLNMYIDGGSQLYLSLQVFALFLIPSLVQALLLRKLIRQAWLWLFSAIVGTIVFAGIMGQFGPSDRIAYPSFAAYAAVTGLTLLWLYGTQVNEGKFKNAFAARRLEDGAEEESADSVELGETVQKKVV